MAGNVHSKEYPLGLKNGYNSLEECPFCLKKQDKPYI